MQSTASILKKIRRIQFQATKLADDILAGAYKSAFKGMGMEFEEVKEYQPGDDIRTIDWNVTARMQRPYVKSFREEREMTVTLIVDVSSSTRFGSGNHTKNDCLAEIAALLAFSAIRNQDKVALILFSEDVEKYFPPRKGTQHVLRIIKEVLVATTKTQGTNIAAALSFLGKVQHRTNICFLLSDFICPDYSHEAALLTRKHELVSLAVVDPNEKTFPRMGLVECQDLETGERLLVDSTSDDTQQKLLENSNARLEEQKKLMQKLGADFFVINTQESFILQLRQFFLMRQKRIR